MLKQEQAPLQTTPNNKYNHYHYTSRLLINKAPIVWQHVVTPLGSTLLSLKKNMGIVQNTVEKLIELKGAHYEC